ncbi:MAG: ZIP family metal transporter [Desulfurococcaceae archaeon]|nr:ZIP family metal transporter [Sulfolobales archaeon]MDW8169830.1 ZIP family metal transporter [Desulfurococcaceae archaeon]
MNQFNTIYNSFRTHSNINYTLKIYRGVEEVVEMEGVVLAFHNGLIVAGFTSLGSLLGLISLRFPRRALDFGLGFASGVMMVASFVGLIIPGIESTAVAEVLIGIAVGAAAIILLDKLLPHEHATVGYEGPESFAKKIRKAWLVALAMFIHNIPEGFAIGVTSTYSAGLGLALSIAIGLQDVPEGLAVTLPLASIGVKKAKAVGLGVLSGLVEMATALAGAATFAIAGTGLKFGLGFAAGAMIYVTIEELVPEVLHENAVHRKVASTGFYLGLYLMLLVDILLG